MAFDPDAYLAKKQAEKSSFDPDAYLAKKMPEGNTLDAIIEPIQAVGGGLANQAASGLAGLGTLINTNDNALANNAIQQTQAVMPDFAPETQAGQRGLETLGDLMQKGVDLANVPMSGLAGLASLFTGQGIDSAAQTVRDVQEKGLSDTLGDNTLEHTGSPGLATAAKLAPDVVGAVTGTTLAKKGVKNLADQTRTFAKKFKKAPKELVAVDGTIRPDFERALSKQGVTLENIFPEDLVGLPDNIKPDQAAKQIIKRKIKSGATDGYLADKKLDDFGRVIDDDAAKAALEAGFEAADVQAMKAANKATKDAMRKMTIKRRKISGNSRLALDAETDPTTIIGQTAMNRVMFVKEKTDEARKRLDEIVKTRLNTTPIDVKPIAQTFAEELKALKVNVKNGKLIFDGSLISKDRAAKGVIKDALDLMNEPGKASALRAHELKKQLDNMIDYKRSASKLTPKGEGLVQSVRRQLNESIRAVDSEYADINDQLTTSIRQVQDFEKTMGAKFSIFDETAEAKAGNELRKLMSKYRISDEQRDMINKLDDLATDLGGNFKEDIKTLALYNKILEKRFGSTREASFIAENKQALLQAFREQRGFKDLAFEKVDELARRIMIKDSDHDAYKAIDGLLKNKPSQ